MGDKVPLLWRKELKTPGVRLGILLGCAQGICGHAPREWLDSVRCTRLVGQSPCSARLSLTLEVMSSGLFCADVAFL